MFATRMNWWRKLVRTQVAARVNRTRMHAEELEARVVPAITFVWSPTGDAPYLWTQAKNWTVDGNRTADYPQMSDTAEFSAGKDACTVPTLTRVSTLDIEGDYSGALNLEGSLTVGGDFAMSAIATISGGTLNLVSEGFWNKGSIKDVGIYILGGTASGNVPAVLTVGGSTTLDINGTTINVSGELDWTGSSLDYDINPQSTIIVQKGGKFTITLPVNPAVSTWYVNTTNNGTVTMNSNSGASLKGNFTNSGTVNVNKGVLFIGFDYTNNAGATTNVIAGTSFNVSGYFSNSGIFLDQSSTVNFNGTAIQNGGQFNLAGGVTSQ